MQDKMELLKKKYEEYLAALQENEDALGSLAAVRMEMYALMPTILSEQYEARFHILMNEPVEQEMSTGGAHKEETEKRDARSDDDADEKYVPMETTDE